VNRRTHIHTEWRRNKWTAVHSVNILVLRELLLNSGFIPVECRCQRYIWRRWRISILCNIVYVKYSLWRHSWCHR